MQDLDQLFISLHTGFPGKAYLPLCNEVTYSGYSKVETSLKTDWFASPMGKLWNSKTISFAIAVGSNELITHVGISDTLGLVLSSGLLTNPVRLIDHVEPQFTPLYILVIKSVSTHKGSVSARLQTLLTGNVMDGALNAGSWDDLMFLGELAVPSMVFIRWRLCKSMTPDEYEKRTAAGEHLCPCCGKTGYRWIATCPKCHESWGEQSGFIVHELPKLQGVINMSSSESDALRLNRLMTIAMSRLFDKADAEFGTLNNLQFECQMTLKQECMTTDKTQIVAVHVEQDLAVPEPTLNKDMVLAYLSNNPGVLERFQAAYEEDRSGSGKSYTLKDLAALVEGPGRILASVKI